MQRQLICVDVVQVEGGVRINIWTEPVTKANFPGAGRAIEPDVFWENELKFDVIGQWLIGTGSSLKVSKVEKKE